MAAVQYGGKGIAGLGPGARRTSVASEAKDDAEVFLCGRGFVSKTSGSEWINTTDKQDDEAAVP